jgi:hypothetical protein
MRIGGEIVFHNSIAYITHGRAWSNNASFINIFKPLIIRMTGRPGQIPACS